MINEKNKKSSVNMSSQFVRPKTPDTGKFSIMPAQIRPKTPGTGKMNNSKS